MRNHERGITTVEFAIVGAVLFIVLFAVIEFGRALFVANALVEGTRRGARVAAICPVGDSRPAQVAIFADGDGVSDIAPDLTTANVLVSYLDQSGATLADPGANYSSIRYVQVSIVDYTQQLLIPFAMPSFLMPPFSATLPIESLGYSPTQQAFLPCAAV
ncbi:pilus assembly protein [Steroidobacter sp. S1-65]|uniref:Pilus assembly protein n=1 Tax=Steroidobacter gossypii TaxID=2805490 RepID=A0ABS1WYM1_9GAMM|nr:TadE family protein [Steroidobacter gossypii]MBM0106076.1 pilus assembly protein [Steroidobacter gossypii]